jgi:hypothetical protein
LLSTEKGGGRRAGGVGGEARRPLFGSGLKGKDPKIIKIGDEHNHVVSPVWVAVQSLSESAYPPNGSVKELLKY